MDIYGIVAIFKDKAGDEQHQLLAVTDNRFGAQGDARIIAARRPRVQLEGGQEVIAAEVWKFVFNKARADLVARYGDDAQLALPIEKKELDS